MRGLLFSGVVMANDALVQAIRHEDAAENARSVIVLRGGACLAVSRSLVRFARDLAALDDPLGNGMRGVLEIPPALAPQWVAGSGYVLEQAGGAILLAGGSVLLIKPFTIELYATPADALHARDCAGRLEIQAAS